MTALVFDSGEQFTLTSIETQNLIDSYRGTDLKTKRHGIQVYFTLPDYRSIVVGSTYGDLAAMVANHNSRNATDRMAA